MLGNMKFGSVVLKLWSETIPWTRVPFGNILGIQEPLTSKLMRIWVVVFSHGLSILKQSDFNQKTSILGS